MSKLISTPVAIPANSLNGAMLVGTHTQGGKTAHFYHTTDTYAVPQGATVIFEGAWTWENVRARLTSGQWMRLGMSVWQVVDGFQIGKIGDRPSGATLIATDLPPHRWLGE